MTGGYSIEAAGSRGYAQTSGLVPEGGGAFDLQSAGTVLRGQERGDSMAINPGSWSFVSPPLAPVVASVLIDGVAVCRVFQFS